jgi:biopolymer transport protein ExbB/TolQ
MPIDLVLLQAAQGAGATEPTRLDPLQLVLDASLVVKLVLLVLLAISLVSWFVVGTKLVRLLQAQRQSSAFLDVFWNRNEGNKWPADRLEAIYARVSQFDGSPPPASFTRATSSSRRSRPPSAARPPTTSRTSSGR